MILKTELNIEAEQTEFNNALESSVFDSKSSFLRHIIKVYLLNKKPQKTARTEEVKPINQSDLKMVEFTVCLPKFVRKGVDHRSREYGLKPTAFIRNLVVANLTNKPILVATQINELRAANRELAAIGRNLNQLTKILNRSAELKLRDRVTHQHLVDIQTSIEKQKKHINDVVASSNHVWSVQNGVN